MARVELAPLPPEEAIAFFRAKHDLRSFDWRDLWQAEHAAAFTVAKSAGFDILADIRGAVDAALADGTTFQTFKQRLEPTLRAKGWWGRGEVVDPATGELVEATLGTPRRLQTIFRTNLRTSYAAGQWERIQRVKDARPYLMYLTAGDDRVRDQHRQWHGIVLPVGDPWWRTHTPPNGWNCFPGSTEVRCDALLGLKTIYAGEMVQLKTALGHDLTVTANHPVLTSRGWLPARLLGKGDNLLRAAVDGDGALPSIVNHQQTPARAEDLFEAMAAEALRVVPMSPNDFYGDAVSRQSNIHIACADRHLVDVIDTLLGQAAAGDDAAVRRRPLDRVAAVPGLFGELLDACAGGVERDEIVEIRKFHWSGHVYDFSTETGLIVAGGVVVSNCRCGVVQLSRRQVEARGLTVAEAPPVATRAWRNRRTGRIERVPEGIDPGWAYNPGAVRGVQLGRVLADKIETMPDRLARAAVADMLKGPGAARLLAGKSDAVPLPVAVLPPAAETALGKGRRVALLSAGTAGKQLAAHPELAAADYGLVQRLLDEAELRLEHGTHAFMMMPVGGRLWKAVVKRTADGRERYLASLHRARPRNLASFRRRGDLVRDALGGP